MCKEGPNFRGSPGVNYHLGQGVFSVRKRGSGVFYGEELTFFSEENGRRVSIEARTGKKVCELPKKGGCIAYSTLHLNLSFLIISDPSLKDHIFLICLCVCVCVCMCLLVCGCDCLYDCV